jgi:hypothetical protein
LSASLSYWFVRMNVKGKCSQKTIRRCDYSIQSQ